MGDGGARVLETATWRDVAASPSNLLVIPLGSTEQHGPHLPLCTDTVVAVALASGLCEERDDAVLGPPLALGASGEHQGFAGTLSIGTDALAGVIVELVRSARHSFRAVVVVSGHGGNHEALLRASRLAREEGDLLVVFEPRLEGADAHAGRMETSMMLALAPELVRHDEEVTGVETPIEELAEVLRRDGVAAVSPSGVLGNPIGASADEGRVLIEQLTAQLVDQVAQECAR